MTEDNVNDIFKAYDVRGIYPKELNNETAFKIGQAIVLLLKSKKIVVGRDNRDSSPMLFENLVNGITSMGCNVIDVGLTITPLLFYSVGRLDADGGIMITASHNPKKYNGFKFTKNQAIPLDFKDLKKLKKLVNNKTFKPSKIKGKIYRMNLLEEYIHKIISYSKTTKKLKIVVDTGNGMGGIIVPKLLSKLQINPSYINLKIDEKKPAHEANPLKTETLRQLQEEVITKKADLGVAFDEDCDRVGFVDEKGNIVPMDLITAFISEIFLKEFSKSKIMYDLRSSKIVKETIIKNNGVPVEYRVGNTFIKKKIRSLNISFAGEVSGHYYFSDFYYTESPLLVLILILNNLENNKLSKIITPFRKYYKTPEINYKVKNVKQKIKELKKKYSTGKIIKIDGIKIIFKDWWFNIRPSNTEPLLRLNLEADTEKIMNEKLEEISKIIKS